MEYQRSFLDKIFSFLRDCHILIKITGRFYSMANTKYNKTEGVINNLQQFKCKTRKNFCQNLSNYYDEMNYRRQSGYFQFHEDVFSSKRVSRAGGGVEDPMY